RGHDDAASEGAPAGDERNLAEQRAQQRRLAGAVGSGDHEPVSVAEREVERPEPERAALHDGALEPHDDVAASVARRERELEAPRLERLLHAFEPLERALRLAHLRLKGVGAAAIGAAGPLREGRARPRLAAPLAEQRLEVAPALLGYLEAAVLRLAGAPTRGFVVAPAARPLAQPPASL